MTAPTLVTSAIRRMKRKAAITTPTTMVIGAAIAMVQAALIVEAGAAKRFDRLIMVTCQPQQRFQRWAQLRKVDQEAAAREVTRRMAAQLPDEEKIKLADYVIDNSGSLDDTQKQVKEVYRELRQQAEKS